MGSVDLVVLDMAGTTIEDRGQVLNAFTATLHEQQVPVTLEELQSWRGASKREVLRVFVERRFGRADPENDWRIERAYAGFRDRLERSYQEDGVQAIPGVEEAFAWLRRRGIGVALTTGFYRKVTDIILRAVGWDQGVIDASVCSDEVPRGRPAPYMIFRSMEATGVMDVRRVIKVGDTALDLQAGLNAGVGGVVGVLSGSQTAEQLGQVAYTRLIDSVAALPELIDGASLEPKPFSI